MELKAENSFTVTKELFLEGMRRLVNRDYAPIARKASIAIGVVWVLLLAITIYTHGHLFVAFIELAAAAFACFWLLVMVPKKRIKRAWRAQESAGGDMKRTTRFYEDRMEVEKTSGDVLIINYEDVADVMESEHLLIMVNKDRLGVMAAKDSFSKGDAAQVQELIRAWNS